MKFWDEGNRAFISSLTAPELKKEIGIKKVKYLEKMKADPLPTGDLPFMLTPDQAVELGLLNSREFQAKQRSFTSRPCR